MMHIKAMKDDFFTIKHFWFSNERNPWILQHVRLSPTDSLNKKLFGVQSIFHQIEN